MLRSQVKSLRGSPAAVDAPQRRLHIGGKVRKEGWEVLNVSAGPAVDHVGDASDLARFGDGTFVEIYASHILEHLDFRGSLQAALREWHRVLAAGGRLYVAVPDLRVLSGLFLGDNLDLNARFGVVKMIFGAHSDDHDYHQVGLDLPLLTYFLEEAGFADIERVASFGLFNDSSNTVFSGVPISLNVIARRPGDTSDA
ncbi:MAG: class I SAM-dependent methyltransferase [Burkholderiales bacterium]